LRQGPSRDKRGLGAVGGRFRRLAGKLRELTIFVDPSRSCIDSGHMVMHGPAMARNKISTTVYITAEQNEMLKLLHQKTKVPVAEYVRQGIDLILEREKKHLPGQLTLDVIRK
jgi:hypothetical protein